MIYQINEIDLIREETINKIYSNYLSLSHLEDVLSPSNKYLLRISEYKNSRIQQIEIIESISNKSLQIVNTNDNCYYSFIIKNNAEYLLFAEDLYGGQSIIDLENNKLISYTINEPDGFIWTSHHLSPNENLLAVVGCYWACPLFIKVYKFDDPMNLPLEEIYSLDTETSSVNQLINWIDNDSFQIQMMDDTENIIKLNLEE